MFEERKPAPPMFSASNIALAIVLHIAFFLMCWLVVQPLRTKETVIPIDLTVVLHENLDGNENEPPPLEKPQPQPPKPPEPPKVEPPEPKPPEKAPDAVIKETPKKPPEKKVEKPKPPEPPKKSAKELREERIRKMQESAKIVKTKPTPAPPKPVTNGRTGKKALSDEEIKRMMGLGAKAGTEEKLATSEEQLCISLIYKAYYDKWESPSYSPTLKDILLRVVFDQGGRVVNWQLVQSSGDAAADASVKRAAQIVKYVPGLTPAFLRKNKSVTVRFKVKPQ